MSVARFEELVERAAAASQIDPEEARRAILSWFESIREALLIEHTQTLPGLGTLKLKRREPYEVRNPRTGETVRVPARFTLRFSETSDLSRVLTAKFALPVQGAPAGESPAPADESDDSIPVFPPPPTIVFEKEEPQKASELTRLDQTQDAILSNLPEALPAPTVLPAAEESETPLSIKEVVVPPPKVAIPDDPIPATDHAPDPIEPPSERVGSIPPAGPVEPPPSAVPDPAPPPRDVEGPAATVADSTEASDAPSTFTLRARPILEGVFVGILIAVLLIVFVVLPYKRRSEPVRFTDVYLTSPGPVRPSLPVAVRYGDTLASLSARYYGDARLWIFLWYDNQAALVRPDVLIPGRDVITVTYRTNGDPAELYLRLLAERPVEAPFRRLEWLRTAYELNGALVRSRRDQLPPPERKTLGL